MALLEELVTAGVISESVKEAASSLVAQGEKTYEQALLENDVSPPELRSAMAEHYGVPAFELPEGFSVEREVLDYIPEESAKHYRIAPLKIEDGVLVVGINQPDNLQVREVLNFVSSKHNLPYKLVFMLDGDISQALKSYENLTGEVDQALGSLESELDAEIATRQQNGEGEADEELDYIKEDAPVTKIVATILRYAVDGEASDVHIEPTGNKTIVRFRVDGLLVKSLELPAKVHSAVVARIKILSAVRLDERRRPQDGRFSATFDHRQIDFRVSILPTNHGEKVVMRILDNENGITLLENTGISDTHLSLIRQALSEPYGIILISGPTGSGKSTTLYAMLSEIDRVGKNVLSLEDPIEYNIDGVSQSQVRPEIGYTFANGLRASLRQDPDVIMVGEIRDKETAQLAIQAALTGHLVLSTIHTNNSIAVIPRLIDMGIDPYLIAPTLKLALAQRLARRICLPGKEVPVDSSIEKMIEEEFATLPEKYKGRIPEAKTVLHPEATPQCATGTKGRVAVMEALPINSRIQELILENGSEEDIFMAAREHGFTTLKEDAIIKALNHTIPFEEVGNFGTKVGIENALEDAAEPVDNPSAKQDTSVYNETNASITS